MNVEETTNLNENTALHIYNQYHKYFLKKCLLFSKRKQLLHAVGNGLKHNFGGYFNEPGHFSSAGKLYLKVIGYVLTLVMSSNYIHAFIHSFCF